MTQAGSGTVLVHSYVGICPHDGTLAGMHGAKCYGVMASTQISKEGLGVGSGSVWQDPRSGGQPRQGSR